MRILVTGATGNIGRLVVDELVGTDVTIRALTLHPERANLPAGVEVVRGNIGKPESLVGLFDDVDKMYLAPFPETTAAVCQMAHDAGVRHIVDVSGDKGSHWGDVARAVEASGVPWTHLSPGEFMENTEIWAEQIRSGGVVHDAFPNAANAMICMSDIAAVAKAVLLSNGHEGRDYYLTGPQSLTRAEQVTEIGIGIGKSTQFSEIAKGEAVAQLEPMMGEFAEWYVSNKESLIECPEQVSTVDGLVNVVEHLIGRPATTLREWAGQNANLFS